MAPLRIPRPFLEAIAEHARASHPEECCGILLGKAGPRGAVVAVVPTANARRDRSGDRYAIPAADLLAAHQRARLTGEAVVGYYHSHPFGTARPSAVDLEHAWPESSYILVATGPDGVSEIRSWRLREAAGPFVEEPLEIL